MWIRALLLVILGLPALALAQDHDPLNEAVEDTVEAHHIYRTVYEVAMLDTRLDEDERAMLEALARVLALSRSQAASIRAAVNAQQPDRLDQSGRWLLMVQNVGWASGLYGWTLPYGLGAEDEKWYVGTQMVSISAAFYLTHRWAKNREVTHARVHMMRSGSGLGFRYGWGLNTLLELNDEQSDDRDWAWTLMAGVPIGYAVGDYLYRRWQPSHGQAWALTLWGDVGSYMVREVHRAIDPEPEGLFLLPDDPQEVDRLIMAWLEDRKQWEKRHTAYDLLSYPLAIYLGHRLTRQKSLTFGDAVMLFQGRALGAGYGALTAHALGADFDAKGNHLARALGTLGGTLALDWFIRDREYTFGQSVLSVLGTVSGASFAAGTAVILEIDADETRNTMIMAGGLVGFWLSDRILNVRKTWSSIPSNGPERQLSVIPTLQPVPIVEDGKDKIGLMPTLQINLVY